MNSRFPLTSALSLSTGLAWGLGLGATVVLLVGGAPFSVHDRALYVRPHALLFAATLGIATVVALVTALLAASAGALGTWSPTTSAQVGLSALFVCITLTAAAWVF